MSSPQRRVLRYGEVPRILGLFKYPRWPFFLSSTHFYALHHLLFFLCAIFFFRFLAVHDYYGAQEDCPSQATPLWFHIPCSTSPFGRSAPFHFSGGRAALPRVALHPFLRSEAGFSALECVLQFHYSDSRLADPVCSPNPMSGPDRP